MMTGQVAVVDPKYASNPILLKALCIYREARGEDIQAKIGVSRTLDNRCDMAPAEGFRATVTENILKPWAFTSFMVGDPNAHVYPAHVEEPAWRDCLAAALHNGTDPTDGAVFYHSNHDQTPPHAWGEVEFTVKIDHLWFFAKRAKNVT